MSAEAWRPLVIEPWPDAATLADWPRRALCRLRRVPEARRLARAQARDLFALHANRRRRQQTRRNRDDGKL